MSAQKAVAEIAAANRLSIAQIAAQFTLAQPAVTSVVTGIRTAEQLADYLSVNNKLSKEEIGQLRGLFPANLYEYHR